MPQAIRKKKEPPHIIEALQKRLREGLFILLQAIAVYFLLTLGSYTDSDPGWSTTTTSQEIQNMGGRIGAWMSNIFFYFFGYLAYFFPVAIAYFGFGVRNGSHDETKEKFEKIAIFVRGIGVLLIVLSGTGLFHFYGHAIKSHLPMGVGGIIGQIVSDTSGHILNDVGSVLTLSTLLLIGITFLTGLSWLKTMAFLGQKILQTSIWLRYKLSLSSPSRIKNNSKEEATHHPHLPITERIEPKFSIPIENYARVRQKPESEKQAIPNVFLEKPTTSTPLPSLELLDSPGSKNILAFNEDAYQGMSRQVELKLQDFGVDAKVVAVNPGPIITRFELQLAPGTKASKVSTLSKDLARSLLVRSVRIVEVIPGKSVIGLELPNENQEVVRLREILESDAYRNARSFLTLGLGKDIAGVPVTVDLTKMPHLLMAGTTGSGKSVCVNAILLSLLYKATPDKVRLLLIDPKTLELSVYEGIPHLLVPVVTDMREASNALRWCINEMEQRYRLMATLGVRNVASFNKKVKESIEKGHPLEHPFPTGEEISKGERRNLEPLPYIVIVIDELADMMMVVGKKIDHLIARLAQKARASGMHLILSTQRPSVDVITGLIKANIPTRIAFQVSSRVDSRTILDQQGAEHLLGNGDMLYLPAGSGLPIRIHGALVDDHEVHQVVSSWKKQGEPQYLQGILEPSPQDFSEDGSSNENSIDFEMSTEEADELYDRAIYIVTQSRRASISHIQRRLKIGYNRAARLIESMEKAGVVSEMETNGSRIVLAPPPPETEKELE